jgi:hypothetical protein
MIFLVVHEMIELGKKLLKEEGFDPENEDQIRYWINTCNIHHLLTVNRLGFHVPPFNSVNHLHMHVIGLPFKNRFRSFKYKIGYLWYMDVNILLQNL